MTPQEAEAAIQRLEIFNWATFLAAFLFGLTAGWNIAFHWYYSKIKKIQKVQPDPLRLSERPQTPRSVTPDYVDSEGRYVEIKVVPERDAA